ncbi:hypothetical protein ACOSQ2_021749 [Xanthoceras sorbifolium]
MQHPVYIFGKAFYEAVTLSFWLSLAYREGSSILVYKDRWIPRPSTFKVVSPSLLREFIMVDHLKSETEGWNFSLLNQTFLPMDVDSILSLPTSSSIETDSLLWHFSNDGYYTVKSDYFVALSTHESPCNSDPSVSNSWLKYIWSLSLPPKIKLFV